MEGDQDLRFLLKGGDLLKVRSPNWKKTRHFKLQEDCKTMWHESKKLFKSNQTCESVWAPPERLNIGFHFLVYFIVRGGGVWWGYSTRKVNIANAISF